MWIIPKNYKLSSHFVADMVESKEDLTLLKSSIESSLMWKSSPTQLRTWLARWKKESWIQHLFLRILKPSHQKSFEEQLTLSLEAIRASRLARLEKDKEKKTHDTCFPTSNNTSMQLDLLDVFSKTSQDTLRWDCPQSSATWKNWVTKQRGEYSVRKKLADTIREKESLSWLTPTTTDIQRTPEGIQKRIEFRESIGRKYMEGCLTEQVMNKQKYPTPTTMDSKPDGLKHATKLLQGKTHRASGQPIQKTLNDKVMVDLIQDNPELMDIYKDHEIEERPHLPTQQKFVQYIRGQTTIKELASKTFIKKTTIEHWFRKDKKGFSYPSIENWHQIKPHLKKIKYDMEMTTVVTKEWVNPKQQKYPTPSVSCVATEQSDRVEKTKSGSYILRKKNKPDSTFGAKLNDAIIWEEKQKYPTPTVGEEKYRLQGNSQASKCLSALARKGELQKYPTPAARDYKGSNNLETTLEKINEGKRAHMNQLPNYIMVKEHFNAEKYPTPTVQDSDKATKKMRDNHQNNLTAVVFNPELSNDTSIDVKNHLNPYWVEALMGLPQGWTALDGTETEMQGTWADGTWEEGIPRVIKGCPNRVDRIRMCGNGVVPQTACIAWRILSGETENQVS